MVVVSGPTRALFKTGSKGLGGHNTYHVFTDISGVFPLSHTAAVSICQDKLPGDCVTVGAGVDVSRGVEVG